MSSSLPLSFNYLPSWHKSSTTPSEFNKNVFSFSSFSKPISPSLSKSHVCFAFSNNSAEYEREETRWLREEQRWMREEQRWIREEQRWEAERESLLNEIKALKLQIQELQHEGANNSISNVTNLLHVLKKEVNQIAESGSSASPLVVEAAAAVEDAVEVVVKEVVRVEEKVKEKEVIKPAEEVKKKEVTKKRTTLRVGSEGDQVQMMQEALQKLGFYCGEEDEEFSSFSTGTERAVKTWQASIDVPETGIMTAELLERLYMDQKDESSGFKESGNGVVVASITPVPETPSRTVNEYTESEHRVFLLGENRWEDSSRLTNKNNINSKGVLTSKCITCNGEGHLLCEECDGTGEPNIEPQFLEWVGEDTKCPYCGGNGHTTCDVCQGSGMPLGSMRE
ncbi:protein disulfide isomerase pTAC5, chloroplastic [Lactuca sativa]|uniref:protein disulfide isomerase pTAC5, chloroplastic n=1 Tax=Lactuca sativa TaxID=4236 RepID=UPI000CB91EFB|nr:protein disulfide isomerase pTAC5, chloroplastic [Lactuca sativa]